MKRALLLCALLAPLSLCAMVNKKVNHQLSGVWQQVQISPTDKHVMHLPVWKVLQNDGNFFIFLITDKSGQSIIAHEGHYNVTSDSTVVEHVTSSVINSAFVGLSNNITYSFVGKDKINITYQLPGAANSTTESWVRVKLEYPHLKK